MSPTKTAPAPADLEDDDDRELEARYLESRVRRINRLLEHLDNHSHWCENHDREKEASEARQFAARLRTTSTDLMHEARAIRAQMQG